MRTPAVPALLAASWLAMSGAARAARQQVTAAQIEQARAAPLLRLEFDWCDVPDDQLLIGAPCDRLKLAPSPDAGAEAPSWGAFIPESTDSGCLFILSDAHERMRNQPIHLIVSDGGIPLISIVVSGGTPGVPTSLYGPSPGSWFGMLHAENDIPNSDQNYTDGERLEIGRVYRTLGILDALTFTASTKQLSAVVGLNMYTPTDISWPAIIEDERPYAGWIYAGLSLASERWQQPTDPGAEPEWRSTLIWEASLGVLGDFLVGDIQTFIHYDVSNSPKPIGWDKDFHVTNVPALYLSGTFEQQLFRFRRLFDLVSVSQLELGNVFSRAHQGGVLRAGWVRAGAAPGRAVASVTTNEALGESFWSRLDAFVFGRLSAALVLWNGTLQGGFAGGPHMVDPRRLVPTGELGVQLGYGRFFINFSHVWRGPEVKTLLGDPYGHDFSQAQVGWQPEQSL